MPNDTKSRGRAKVANVLPEWVPLPSGKEVEIHSGLRRGSLNQLVLPCAANNFRPPVKSFAIKRPGAVKGRRLIVLASLLSFLRKLQQEQDAPPVTVQKRTPRPAARKGAAARR